MQMIDIGKGIAKEIPSSRMVWIGDGSITACKYLNYIRLMFLQVVPALAIDAILRHKGHKPMYV